VAGYWLYFHRYSIYDVPMGNPKREAMLSRIHAWHENDEHENILDEIDKIPREFWDYEVTCLYARALNNLERYEEALDHLMHIKTHGRNDALWHFRTGYSLYYLGEEDEATGYFQKALDLGDNSDDTRKLLKASRAESEQKKHKEGTSPPLIYSEEEMNALERHIEKYFGPFTNVFHEIASPDIHVDIAVVEPTPERNYYILVTMGMGARKMSVPKDLAEFHLERAELLVCLPPDWKLDDLEDEKWYWPLRWLKILARLPCDEDTWLGWGHTIPNGSPFAENTRLSAVMLISPGAFGKKSHECLLPGGEGLNFYQIIPLYDEEVEYKLKHDAKALLDLMDDEDLAYIKSGRKNVVKDLNAR
jgi:tetratricopeptide (TPR) repeat protein